MIYVKISGLIFIQSPNCFSYSVIFTEIISGQEKDFYYIFSIDLEERKFFFLVSELHMRTQHYEKENGYILLL